MPNDVKPGTDVAIIAAPRLPYHPMIEERFGIDRASWRALTEAVFPAAKTTDAIVLALSYCRARKLDPFKRVVHIVPVYDRESGGYIETVWPGIAEHRITAFRTKQYAGADAASFGPTVEKQFKGETKRGAVSITLKFPDWCQVTVYRLIDGQRVPLPGPRVYWLETYSRMGRTEVPNEMWQKRPFGQIEKCAEAAALRRAFPEELGDEATSEEVEAADPRDVTPIPERPTRAAIAAPAEDADTDSAEAHSDAGSPTIPGAGAAAEPPAREPTQPAPAEPNSAAMTDFIVPLETGPDGKPDYGGWAEGYGDIVNGAGSAAELDLIEKANAATAAGAPKLARDRAAILINKRRAQLKAAA